MAMSKTARDIRQPALGATRKQRVTITVAMTHKMMTCNVIGIHNTSRVNKVNSNHSNCGARRYHLGGCGTLYDWSLTSKQSSSPPSWQRRRSVWPRLEPIGH